MVRPLDLQDNLSKAPLAGREQQVQQASSEVAQRQLGREQAQEQIVDHSRTRPATQSDRADLHPEDREGGRPGREDKGRELPGAKSAADEAGAEETGAETQRRDTSSSIDIIA